VSNEEYRPEDQHPFAEEMEEGVKERAEQPTAESLFGAEEPEPKEAVPAAEDIFGPEELDPDDQTPVAQAFFAADVPEEAAPKPVPKPSRKAEADGDAGLDGEEEEAPRLVLREPPDDGIERRWYALHAHSGQEGNVRSMLLISAEQRGLADLVTNVFVPMEEVAEVRSGETKTHSRKFFPGYVLVQLPKHPEGYPELWQLIKETPGVTGFIGSRNLPSPLEDSEVEAVVEVIRGERERPKPEVAFDVGERVKIIDGPFANFLGKIDAINAERGTMKVLVEIFERMTSIEVEFWQVEQV